MFDLLTIISVSYKSKSFLEMNYKLVKALNPDTPFHWIVVQNTPESDLSNDLAMDDPRFEMIPGVVLTEHEKGSSFYRSIHHAKGLNLALAYASADRVLTLDPDCFILMPNWITVLQEYLKQKEMVFFGVPYHPKYYGHYRNFPNAICMFINRGLLQAENYFSLDFMPVFEGRLKTNKAIEAINYHSRPKQFFSFFRSTTRKAPLKLSDFHRVLAKSFKKLLFCYFQIERRKRLENGFAQFKIGKCLDTGYKIYKQYKDIMKHQVVEIFALDERKMGSKLFESILPNRFRTFPRHRSFITKKSSPLFSEFEGYGEQFYWDNQLFGFHLKGVIDHLAEDEKQQLNERLLKKIGEIQFNLVEKQTSSNS